MKKYLIFPLIVLMLLACRALSPKSAAMTPLPVTAIATSHLEATAFAPNPNFTLVRIYREDGNLRTQLIAEAKKAKKLGQVPFVEYDATWCPPCENITEILASKNPLMMDAYRGVYLIHLDTDNWGWGDEDAGFVIDGIPAFFAFDPETGEATGAMIDGGDWGEDIPRIIAPALDNFFHP
jgi:thiol-disulfide isomerase/thioredoxin